MKTRNVFLAGMALALLAACGGAGGGSNPGGDDDPPTHYRFVKSPASTAGKLVLDLYGPAGMKAKGVALYLTVDTPGVSWANAGGPEGTYSNPGTALDLGSSPRLYKDLAADGDLQVGIFQKTGSATFDDQHPIVSIALSGTSATEVALSETRRKDSIMVAPDGSTSDITIDLGSFTID